MALPAILVGCLFVSQAVTFMQFIHEEAIQSCSMAVYMAVRNRRYSAAREALRDLKDIHIPMLEDTTKTLGWLAPWTIPCFTAFALASKRAAQTWEEILTGG